MNSFLKRREWIGRTSRYSFIWFWALSLVVGWLLLRVVIFLSFKPESVSVGSILRVFAAGLQRDLLVALAGVIPLLLWMMLTPERRFKARWHRALLWTGSFLFWFACIFLLFVEYFFFEEFRSRFNTVALDYLIYPHEVFVNIWDSYHVGIVLLICGIVALGWLGSAAVLFRPMWKDSPLPRHRLLVFTGMIVACAALATTVNLKGPRIGSDRTLNEMANNGAISFLAAAWTHHLDYGAFYKTMSKAQAYARVRQLVSAPESQFLEQGNSIRRRIAGNPAGPRLNVILFLEESLGSEFWGSLGRKEATLTPEMDKLAAEEGMLFSNIYASGNRTVRGMEGVLSSFPPLPGDSIVKRDLSDNVETIARVLKRDGYSTLFLYGGRGLFDGMRSFAVRNGYDRFIEQKHFEKPTFTTIWGVCDEDLFNRTLEECVDLSKAGRPFFATVLSVSNHKPYTYPKGKIPEDPEARTRENAVKYSDFALGQFFRAAKREPLWTNTIFVVVADHGARVYGKQSIPIHSYEIPFLIAGPAAVKSPSRPAILGCSTDVAPTVLGLVGRPYDSMFFGQDLLKCPADHGRAFLNHNRDIGVLRGDKLVVLGLMQGLEVYTGDPKIDMSPLPKASDAEQNLILDTIAAYQVADDLYTHERYRVDESSPASAKRGN